MESLASAPHHEGADQVMTVAWRTRAWGWFLLAVAVAGLPVALAIRVLDEQPWSVGDVALDAILPALLGYLALVLLRDRTELRLLPGGVLLVRTVPLPFLPPTRVPAQEQAYVDASRSLGKRPGSGWRWRVELVTPGNERHPLCFGGIESRELAEETAQAVRRFLRLGAAPGAGAVRG